MAFSSILRRSSSATVPLSIRVVGSNFRFQKQSGLFLQTSNFSSMAYAKRKSDDDLIQAIDNEVKSMETRPIRDIPASLPFRVGLSAGRSISLMQDFPGETIGIMPFHALNLYYYGDGSDAKGNKSSRDSKIDEDNDKKSVDEIPLYVSILKNKGTQVLKLRVSAALDNMLIDTIYLRQSKDGSDPEILDVGQYFSCLGKGIQEALVTFLEVRGINRSTAKFLHDYYKENKELHKELRWLKQVEKFVKS